MWVYVDSTGDLYDPTGKVVSRGYSGKGDDKNKPEDECVIGQGPIPEGFYTAGEPIDSPKHGPFAIPLIPDPSNDMYGRSSFMMHGDSREHPGGASEGCIIQPRFAREAFKASGEKLEVVAEMPPYTESCS